MCRIAGIISKKQAVEESRNKVQKMCTTLQHGGPDDEGFFADEQAGVVLGHRRLSIIDLSVNGHQPMGSGDKKVWITFNGEIYNYIGLKQQLQKEGAVFYTQTDTEVIIQAYIYWGVTAFGKLRGMFAFALFDAVNATTYLVRDTQGIKPLYYHISNGELSFASEIKALKTAGIATAEDATWQIRLLSFGNIPEPNTTLKNVFSLPKGNYLAWDHRAAAYTITSFNEPKPTPYITDVAEARQLLNNALTTAINRQLIADAPIGVFLSGGIDSSLLTLLAAKQKQEQLKTISIFFDEKAYDESRYQQLVLASLSGQKFSHLVRQKDFDENFAVITGAMDMPTTDGINTWFISKYAHADGLKAVLSGVGADELFGGYPSFNRIKYIGYLRKLPSALFNLAKYTPADRYKKMAFLGHQHHLADYLLLRGLFAATDIAKILDTDAREVNDVLFNTTPALKPVTYDKTGAAWFESNFYMQNQLLRDTDVMSMSHGLEVRVPFLDEDFVNVVESISPAIRFANNPPKKLLTDSFSNILPGAIINRSKMGFTFPLQQWMRDNDQICDDSLYKSREAKNKINSFRKGQMHWSKAFALYQIYRHG